MHFFHTAIVYAFKLANATAIFAFSFVQDDEMGAKPLTTGRKMRMIAYGKSRNGHFSEITSRNDNLLSFSEKGAGSLMRNITRKRLCVLLAVTLLLAAISVTASGADTASDASEPGDDALVTYGYLQKQLDQLRQELMDAIGDSSDAFAQTPGSEETQNGGYRDITLKRGSILRLGSDTEVIFRGGSAVVITASDKAGDGITDLSTGTEFFSGAPLCFAHLYYKTNPEGCAYLLVTGEKASFTLKGA